MALPLLTQGPDMLGALAMLILLPVEKRKYVPSEVRRMSAGSCEFPQTPEQGPGVAYAVIRTTEKEKTDRICERENMIGLGPQRGERTARRTGDNQMVEMDMLTCEAQVKSCTRTSFCREKNNNGRDNLIYWP
jgi:hypothetical protein